MIPFRTPSILPFLFPSFAWRIQPSQKELFLTFDDGPVEGPTEFVLDILRQTGSHATFFCIGDNVKKYPHVFKQIIHDGHREGNHTYNHLNAWKTPSKKYLENVKRCEAEMLQHLPSPEDPGKPLFRPPYGRFPFHSYRAFRNFKVVMWDVLTHDYDRKLSQENCLRKSIAATRDGSIIVFHDSFKAERNLVYTLPRLIGHFREKGYVFKALPL